MNEACDRCGPAVRAVYHASRDGQLYLCGHCADQLRPTLSAQGWAIRPVARDLLGIFGAVAVASSFVGGFLLNLVKYHSLSVQSHRPIDLIGSIFGACLLLLLLRLTGREPGRRLY